MTHGLQDAKQTLCGSQVYEVVAREHTVTTDPILVDCPRCRVWIPAEPEPASTLEIIPTAERIHEKRSALRAMERG